MQHEQVAGEPAPEPAPHAAGTAPPPGARFAELDAFRGVAVLMVVVYHYAFRYDALAHEAGLPGHDAGLDLDWARPGGYGVHLFFMISGFVICWSLSTADGLRGFALSRFSRIYPAFWIAALATFGVVHAFGEAGGGSLLGIAVAFATVLALSQALSALVERPASRALRRRFGRARASA